MKRWKPGVLGCLCLAVIGCDVPEQIVPAAPPGANIPRTPPDKDDPAQAQGESIAFASKTTTEKTTKPTQPLATPTAKGETKTTKNGVKYETLVEGNGDELQPGKVAKLRYALRLEENGPIIEQTPSERTSTFTIGVGGLIQGWEEGLPGMKVGEKRKLVVPAAAGYRDQTKGKIPPNSTLIFEVELLGVN